MSFLTDCNDIAAKLKKPRASAVFVPPFELVTRQALSAATGLSRSSIYAKMKPGTPYYDPAFPLPLRVGLRAVAWRADELTLWLNQLPRAAREDVTAEDEA